MFEFKDEILDFSNQSDMNARYTIRNNNGDVINDDVQLELKTPLVEEGTPLNAANIKKAVRSAIGESLVIDGGDIKNCTVASGGVVNEGDLVNLVYQPESDGNLLDYKYYGMPNSLSIRKLYNFYPLERDVVLIAYQKGDNTYGMCVCELNDNGKYEPLGNELSVENFDADPPHITKCNDRMFVYIRYGTSSSNYWARTLSIDENYEISLGVSTTGIETQNDIIGRAPNFFIRGSSFYSDNDAILTVNMQDGSVTFTATSVQQNNVYARFVELFEDNTYVYYMVGTYGYNDEVGYIETAKVNKQNPSWEQIGSRFIGNSSNDAAPTRAIKISSNKVLLIYNTGAFFRIAEFNPTTGQIVRLGPLLNFASIEKGGTGLAAEYYYLFPRGDDKLLLNVVNPSDGQADASFTLLGEIIPNTLDINFPTETVKTIKFAPYANATNIKQNINSNEYLSTCYSSNYTGGLYANTLVKMLMTIKAVEATVDENDANSLRNIYGIAKESGAPAQSIKVYTKKGVEV